MVQNPHHYPWCHAPQLLQDCPARRWLNALLVTSSPRPSRRVNALKSGRSKVESDVSRSFRWTV